MDSQHTCAGICAWLIAGLLCLGGVGPAYAETFAGPVEARVISVLDGDTFLAEARVWPGHTVRVNIRIRGIDAPEKRARCTAERAAAQAAREALHALIGEGRCGSPTSPPPSISAACWLTSRPSAACSLPRECWRPNWSDPTAAGGARAGVDPTACAPIRDRRGVPMRDRVLILQAAWLMEP
jgi:hypothetical protein